SRPSGATRCGATDARRAFPRLVPAGKRAPGVGGLELRGREGPADAGGILIRAAIEAAQLVVEDAGEREAEPPLAGRDRRRERQPAALETFLQRHRGLRAIAAVALEPRVRDRELGGIEDDLRGRLAHGEGDRLDAGERRRHQIRLEPDLVTCWDDVTRKPVEIHGLVASRTGDWTIRTLPQSA